MKIGTLTIGKHAKLVSRQGRHKYEGRNILKLDSDSFEIGIDNHSTKCISHRSSDFIGAIRTINSTLNGISGSIKVRGIGTVQWDIMDDDGNNHKFIIRDCLYIPKVKLRLFSPQQWSQQRKEDKNDSKSSCITLADKCVLLWDTFTKTIPLHPATNVAIMMSSPGVHRYKSFCSLHDKMNKRKYLESTKIAINSPYTHNDAVQADESLNHMMTSSKGCEEIMDEDKEQLVGQDDLSEFMRWHHRLGHLSYSKMKTLCLLNILPRKLLQVKPPKCPGCLYSTMTRRPWTTKHKQDRKKIFHVGKPGDCVSIDQMESSTPGFVGQIKGILTKQRYRAITVFVDHYSRYTYIHLQKDMTSESTIQAKIAFEAHAYQHGIKIKHYHADNGRFTDNAFMQHAKREGQRISLCGVNAHNQNGIAERKIRDLQEGTRKLLMHAKSRWEKVIDETLWPYAMITYNDQANHLPDKVDGSSKMERFSQVEVSSNLKNMHTWGCPAYVLHESLQGMRKINKWDSRAKLGAYIGNSPRHARTVSLILNLQTGHVSPQFHVQHDNFFETVKEIDPMIKRLKWKSIAGLNRTTETSTNEETMTSFQDKFSHNRPNVEIESETTMVPLRRDTQVIEETSNPLRRSSRVRKMTDRMRESIEQGMLARNSTITQCDEEYFEIMHNLDYSIQQDLDSPITYLAKTDRDTMYLHQAVREPDREKFVQAVIKEMNDHIVRNHWKLIPISQVPANHKVLDAVWSMKRKRHLLTGEVYKWKARLNIHGGQQEYAVNYFDTYAPVVAWPVIRILMTLSILNKWKTRQIDFVLAYPQAKNQYDIYMRLPHGIQMKHTKEQHCLKLQRNLYGGRDAGRTFYLFMLKGLKELGFSKSAIDECVFYRDDTIFFSYVDDGIIIAPNENKIKTIISDLNKKI